MTQDPPIVGGRALPLSQQIIWGQLVLTVQALGPRLCVTIQVRVSGRPPEKKKKRALSTATTMQHH